MLPERVEDEITGTVTWPSGSYVSVIKGDRLRVTVSFVGEQRRHAHLIDQAMVIGSCGEKAIVTGTSDDFIFQLGADTDPANPEPASLRFVTSEDRYTFTLDVDVERAKGQTWMSVLDTYAVLDLD